MMMSRQIGNKYKPMKSKIFLVLTLFFALKIQAQKTPTDSSKTFPYTLLADTLPPIQVERYRRPAINPRQSLALIARVDSGRVVLRWMPTTYATWRLGIRHGYDLYRCTLTRDGKKVKADSVKLNTNVLRTPLLPFWQNYGKINAFAEVAGRLIHTPTDSSDQARDFSFGLAMLMSSTTAGIATAMGMRWEDKTALPNETYRYSAVVHGKGIVARTMVIAKTLTRVRPPIALRATYQDSTVFVGWQVSDSLLHVAYLLERSDDGGLHYHSVSTAPILISDPPDAKGRVRVGKTDKIPRLYYSYFYRVRAYTPFGDFSPPSALARVSGHLDVLPRPVVRQRLLSAGKVELSWTFPDTLNGHIKGFEIMRADSLGGKYGYASPQKLPPTARSFVVVQPQSQNYYQVVVLDWVGKPTASAAEFVQLQDSIAPAAPRLLRPRVEPSGLVRLRWRRNGESDLAGYSVYRSNNPRAEFSLVSRGMRKDTTFYDTLALNVLDKYVYYCVQAYDKRLNASLPSDTLRIVRPDTIAPASPNFTQVALSDSSILLGWAASPSTDVLHTLLLRQAKDERQAVELLRFTPQSPQATYNDTTALEDKTYRYTLLAVDEGGRRSAGVWVEKERLKSWVGKSLTGVGFGYDSLKNSITLRWPAPKKAVANYLLYRQGPDDSAMSLYKYLPGAVRQFVELRVQPNLPYRYQLMAVYSDQTESKLGQVYEAILVKRE